MQLGVQIILFILFANDFHPFLVCPKQSFNLIYPPLLYNYFHFSQKYVQITQWLQKLYYVYAHVQKRKKHQEQKIFTLQVWVTVRNPPMMLAVECYNMLSTL